MKQAQVGWLVRILPSHCVVLDKDPFVDVSKGHLVRRWGVRETQGEVIAAHGETVGVLDDGPRFPDALQGHLGRVLGDPTPCPFNHLFPIEGIKGG